MNKLEDEELYEICEKILTEDIKYNNIQKECILAYNNILKDLTSFADKTCELMEYSHKIIIEKIKFDLENNDFNRTRNRTKHY